MWKAMKKGCLIGRRKYLKRIPERNNAQFILSIGKRNTLHFHFPSNRVAVSKSMRCHCEWSRPVGRAWQSLICSSFLEIASSCNLSRCVGTPRNDSFETGLQQTEYCNLHLLHHITSFYYARFRLSNKHYRYRQMFALIPNRKEVYTRRRCFGFPNNTCRP